MRLVAGIDSSTQGCKVTVRDAASGIQLRFGKASHPAGTIIDPEVWWRALLVAVERAGGLEDVAAISVSGQQHTPVFLDARGRVVCDSPLWNDVGSHPHLVDLNEEVGRAEWIRRTGLPLTLSDTVTKLRWLRDEHPLLAARTAAVALVHDWLTWRLMGHGGDAGDIGRLTTDRSEASGTGYWSPDTGQYCLDLVDLAFGRLAALPRVLPPLDSPGVTGSGIPGVRAGVLLGVGSGDNAAAAMALGIQPGDAVMSLGTSGVVYTRSADPVHDFTGSVCNYADATGGHLPLVATLNAARNFEAGASLLGSSFSELSELALRAPSGAEGLTLLPYFEGERTPDLPDATGSLLGATLANLTRSNFARAVIEGTLVSQVAMLDALRACDIPTERLLLIGGAAQSAAVQSILAHLVDVPVLLPEPDEYVAMGAALQAAAALDGEFADWPVATRLVPPDRLDPQVVVQYRAAHAALGYAS